MDKPDPRSKDETLELLQDDSEYDEGEDTTPPLASYTIVPNGPVYIYVDTPKGNGHATVYLQGQADQPVYELAPNTSTDRKRPKIILSQSRKPIAHLYHDRKTGYKIGIDRSGSGDSSAVQWIELKRSGFAPLSKKVSFQWNHQTIVIERMRGQEIGITDSKRWFRHYKVINEGTNEVLGTYMTVEAYGQRKGTLTLQDGLDEDMHVVVIIGLAEQREMARRQQRTAMMTAGAWGHTVQNFSVPREDKLILLNSLETSQRGSV